MDADKTTLIEVSDHLLHRVSDQKAFILQLELEVVAICFDVQHIVEINASLSSPILDGEHIWTILDTGTKIVDHADQLLV